MLGALHPYGLQRYATIAVAFIAFGNFVFGALYMYSLGIFNEGGGSYTASMRYLTPALSLIVAVVLIQDYVLTIVVSTLSGVDQLLSITDSYGIPWFWHFILGAVLAWSFVEAITAPEGLVRRWSCPLFVVNMNTRSMPVPEQPVLLLRLISRNG